MSITPSSSATILTIYHGAPGTNGVATLTTTGSGAATLVGGTLNIPTPTPANIGAEFVTEYKTAAFTAVVGHNYNANDSGSGFTVTNPATATAGDWFDVFVQDGTVTVNAVARAAGSLVKMRYIGAAWVDTLTVANANTLAGYTPATLPVSTATQTALDSKPTIPSAIQTANYTATSGETVLVDTSDGPITITLPSPVIGAVVTLKDVGGNAATNNITVNRSNGMTLRVVNISGTTTTWHCMATTTNDGGGTWARSQFDITNDAIGQAPDSQMLAGYTPETLPVSTATQTALDLKVNSSSISNVTNDAQTKAAIVPNTAPAAGQLLVGNAGGTAYVPVSASGDASIASTGVITVSHAGYADSADYAGYANGAGYATYATYVDSANYANRAGYVDSANYADSAGSAGYAGSAYYAYYAAYDINFPTFFSFTQGAAIPNQVGTVSVADFNAVLAILRAMQAIAT